MMLEMMKLLAWMISKSRKQERRGDLFIHSKAVQLETQSDSIQLNSAQLIVSPPLLVLLCMMRYSQTMISPVSITHSSLIRSDTQPLFTHSHSAWSATSMTMKFPRVSDLPLTRHFQNSTISWLSLFVSQIND